jgi:EAL domain-containing protein (putative c-di-GMP-specific phosphodiesterase class I)
VARIVGVKTVAEFVDRPEVLAKLRVMGIDYAQGFLLHRPAPLNDLLSSNVVACA